MLLPKCDENNDNYWNWINCLKCWGILQSANFGRVFCPATRKFCYICCVRFCAPFCPINARWNLSPVRALRMPVLKVGTHTLQAHQHRRVQRGKRDSSFIFGFCKLARTLSRFHARTLSHLSKTTAYFAHSRCVPHAGKRLLFAPSSRSLDVFRENIEVSNYSPLVDRTVCHSPVLRKSVYFHRMRVILVVSFQIVRISTSQPIAIFLAKKSLVSDKLKSASHIRQFTICCWVPFVIFGTPSWKSKYWHYVEPQFDVLIQTMPRKRYIPSKIDRTQSIHNTLESNVHSIGYLLYGLNQQMQWR